jgi:hypothetical protein
LSELFVRGIVVSIKCSPFPTKTISSPSTEKSLLREPVFSFQERKKKKSKFRVVYFEVAVKQIKPSPEIWY